MKSNNRSDFPLDNSKIKIDVFRNIFCLFYISGIFKNKYTKCKESSILTNIVIAGKIIFNIITFLYFFLTTSSYILSMKHGLKLKITYAFMDVLSILNRIYLQRNFKHLKDSAKVACEYKCFKMHKTISKSVWVTVWSVITNALFVLSFFLDLNAEEVTGRLLFGYKSKSVLFTYLQVFLYVCCTGIFFYMPFNTFTMYYTMLCYEVKNMICDYINMLKSTDVINYDSLNEMYSGITSRVKFIDSKVGIFVFISFLFNSFMMHSMLVTILNIATLNINGMVVFTVKMLCCSVTLVNFTVQLYCASSVHNASLLVKDKTAIIKESNPKFISSYLSFVLTHQEEICMTVWGIASIKKSFIFGTFGTILTYCLLFDSIKTNNN